MTKLNKIKKRRKQPHFIVLVRGVRDEGVLVSCKMPDGMEFTTGPAAEFAPCGSIPCASCYDVVSS